MPTPLTDADKVLRNDTGKSIASKLDDIKNAILNQSTTLNDLSDVSILSVQDGQFLKYDSTENKWVNVSLPDPMVFKGTLGTSGTITTLPVDGSANIGDTYKVIEDGTYAGVSAKVGDLFSCLTKSSSTNTWVLIPSGDESFTDTWRGIKVNGTEKLTSSISSGEVDFVAGTNIQIAFDSTGNKITISASDVYTKSETDTEIVNGITSDTYNSFDTNEKTVIGAVNEVFDYTTTTTDTASGAIATFDTSLALPLQDCTIAINAVQESGTPTPSSPKAISGFTGANVAVKGANLFSLTEDTVRADRHDYLSACTKTDTSVTATSTANAYAFFGRFLFLPKGNYCIKYQATSSDSYSPVVAIYNGTTKIISNIASNTATTFTLSEDMIVVVRMYVSRDEATVRTVTFSDIQIEKGNSVSETYIPYVSNTNAISWQDEAGTVYGGSLDVTSGVLTVTHGFKTYTGGADEDWRLHGSIANLFYIDKSLNNAYLNNAEFNYAITNMFVQKGYNRITSLANGEFGLGDSSGTQRLAFKYTDVATVADWKTWLSSNNLTIAFKLATPVTYQLTPTQISAIVGTNNVFTDTNGDTSVVYYTKSGESIAKISSDISVNNTINHTYSELDTSSKTIIGGINELAKDKNVADEYDDTHTYNTGDVTIYDNTLYICNTNNTTGTFDPSKWTATTIDNIIGDLSQLTTSVTSSLVGAVNEVNGKASTTDFTFTPDSSVNATSVIASQNDKLCILTMEVNFTGNANTWKDLGIVNKVPKVNHCSTACVNSSNGTYLGMVNVRQTDGKVRVYPISNVSNGYGIFTICYITA